MKILIIQEYSRHKTNILYRECLCYERAFRALGHEAVSWGLGHKNFKDKIQFNEFDFIFCLENYGDEWLPDLSPYKNPIKIIYAIDPHVRGIECYKEICAKKGFNMVFCAVEYFCNNDIVYLPNAIDNNLFYNKNIKRDIDFGFVGNQVTLERSNLINYCSDNLNLKVNIGVFGDEMVNLLNKFKFAFNKNISIDVNYRNYETISCGAVLITNYSEAAERLGFKHDVNCLMYNSEKDIINFLNIDSNKVEDLIKNGFILAEKHTYAKRVTKIIEFLNSL